ncbi:MAG TPA: cytochrome c oxidase subunit 4 [Pseudonocardiaceae bacterium]
MKIEGRIFLLIAAFLFVLAVVYGVLTKVNFNKVEPVGVTAFILSGALCLLVGTFLGFVSRRLEGPRPEDNPEAEISDGSGEVGFFPPGSYWPVAVGAACAFGAIAITFWSVWLLVLAGAVILFTVGGFVFEYHIGASRQE